MILTLEEVKDLILESGTYETTGVGKNRIDVCVYPNCYYSPESCFGEENRLHFVNFYIYGLPEKPVIAEFDNPYYLRWNVARGKIQYSMFGGKWKDMKQSDHLYIYTNKDDFERCQEDFLSKHKSEHKKAIRNYINLQKGVISDYKTEISDHEKRIECLLLRMSDLNSEIEKLNNYIKTL